MKAFVLSAGFGTRMGRLTADRPKPLLEVRGVPMILYTLFQLKRWGTEECVINLHYKGDQIRSALKDFPHFRLIFSDEAKILGTAGGICKALEYFGDEPFVLVNPDMILSADETDHPRYALEILKRTGAVSCLSLERKADGSNESGWDLDTESFLRPANPGRYYYMGCSVISPRVCDDIESGTYAELGPIWKSRGASRELAGRVWAGSVVNVGTEEALENARRRDLVPASLKDAWADFLDFKWSV
ncbi:MAG: nucleotidyltransferase family protein [Spirochaetia bacterium]|nr:nucleotidyltransferase family protein [Spirochaetia bacterium]